MDIRIESKKEEELRDYLFVGKKNAELQTSGEIGEFLM